MTKQKDNSLFDAINSINDKKVREINHNKANGYIISLWLSQEPELIKYVNKINPYIFSIDNKLIFKYYMKSIPKKKRFIKWTKKNSISKEKTKQIEDLCLKHNISKQEALLSLED